MTVMGSRAGFAFGHQRDGSLARLDVDAGRGVAGTAPPRARAVHSDLPPAAAGSSMCFPCSDSLTGTG